MPCNHPYCCNDPSHCNDCVFFDWKKASSDRVEDHDAACYWGYTRQQRKEMTSCMKHNPPREEADDDFPGVDWVE